MNCRLKALQTLQIELFFNGNLLQSFINNPEVILSERGLNNEDLKLFAAVKSEAFLTESYGRQFLIAKEIKRHFESFFKNYLQLPLPTINEVMASSLIQSFFCSQEFLFCQKSFPHYTGIGEGFENSSSFFLFALDYLKESKNKDLTLDLYIAMAAHLNFQAKFSDDPFYIPLTKGVHFNFEGNKYVVLDGFVVQISNDQQLGLDSNLNNIVSVYKNKLYV